jgi:hypothetical protein
MEFMSYTAARRARHPKKGALAQVLNVLLMRGQVVTGDPDLLKITVVSYMNRKHGFHTRRQSGVRVFHGDDLPDDVEEALAHEIARGIPEGMRGKSVFHIGERLVRVVCRQGLDVLDLDLRRCYTHLRYLHAPAELQGQLKCFQQLLADPKFLTAKLAALEQVSEDDMKTMITAAGNMQRISPRANGTVEEWLQTFKKENGLVIEANKAKHADLYERVKASNPRHADLTFISIIDQHLEAEVINKIDNPHASNEYDGVVFFFKTGDEADSILQQAAALVEPMHLSVKPYGNPLELAKQKYPNLDWDHVNSMEKHRHRVW